MLSLFKGWQVLLWLILWGLSSTVKAEGVLAGTVVGVHDGDTITVLTFNYQTVKVRLAQIDAPEKRQAFGEVSKQTLARRVMRQTVKVEIETTDKYGRLAGKVLLNGMDINREQVEKGMAWVYTQYAHEADYLRAQERAQRAKLGLWQDKTPIPPWVFRHSDQDYAVTPSAPEAKKPFWFGWWGMGCEKKTCAEMTSCEEAKRYLHECDLKRLDSDKNGVPCESLCRGQH
ncbi:MAG: thermonuclease family protein [Thiofilum sp.]|uniref:thermonuclease family protein n=1 Tax=Thiofilum sp. TaxID=2212733 RepID=UPI0025E98DE9|nr:thermonuclease family protein [Thiofilum sp.]MBK8454256.1 thermonuclease family protein [Thiofilum sp.]